MVWSFSALLDIDKLILAKLNQEQEVLVLVLCWILINLYLKLMSMVGKPVLVLCWILINLYDLQTSYENVMF